MCSIREALENFQKESKKFVTAYFQGESISQKEYYLGSVAKECYAFPTSSFYLTGLGSEQVFFKNLFDKLDVEVDIVRGENNDFKSAVEPFFFNKTQRFSQTSKHTIIGDHVGRNVNGHGEQQKSFGG